MISATASMSQTPQQPVPLHAATSLRADHCGTLALRLDDDRGDDGSGNDDHMVSLCGWIGNTRRLGGLLFTRLRDSYGEVQIVLDEGSADAMQLVAGLGQESVVRVVGRVRRRPAGQENTQAANGALEVAVLPDEGSVEVLNAAEPLPIPFEETKDEELRLRHRHLDLRRPEMQRNLRMRSAVARAARNFLCDSSFVEVETPTLFRSTPEGAQEFVVPTRSPGLFYALPQSPQQFKQLLMAGGVDRYFQVARCYRDEGGRADRQPEFTQVDLEMSFVGVEDIMAAVEGVVGSAWQAAAGMPGGGALAPISLPRPRMPYRKALVRYGSDKPDLRFELPIVDVSAALVGSSFVPFERVLASAEEEAKQATEALGVGGGDDDEWQMPPPTRGSIRAVALKGYCKKEGGKVASLSRREREALVAGIPKRGDAKLFVATLQQDGDGGLAWQSDGFAKKLTASELDALAAAVGAEAGDAVVLAAGRGIDPCERLGFVRSRCGNEMMQSGALDVEPDACSMFWVVDFPLFLPSDEEGGFSSTVVDDQSGTGVSLDSAHHPFTAPHPDHTRLLEAYLEAAGSSSSSSSSSGGDAGGGTATAKEVAEAKAALLEVQGLHVDLVCNGLEIGGGGVRIHNADLQAAVMRDVLELPRFADSFAHLLDALRHGCPPHGGFAVGLDRLVALLAGTSTLRDVIAFPKSTNGRDLMTGAPSRIGEEDLAAYHIAERQEQQEEGTAKE